MRLEKCPGVAHRGNARSASAISYYHQLLQTCHVCAAVLHMMSWYIASAVVAPCKHTTAGATQAKLCGELTYNSNIV
eukprot:10862-Heterococcus_DN1.PRE.3